MQKPVKSQNSKTNQIEKGDLNSNPSIKPADRVNYNEVIILNTDGKPSSQPEDGLEVTRQNRIDAILGSQSDLVSIIIQAFNRLEKTKKCIECVLKYTTNINYELILLDNGSTDGTLEYFKSVPYDRKIIVHVTNNVGSLAPGPQIEWNGRYLVFIPNDICVTHNWLENLLKCLKSDPRIGLAVPVIFNEDHNELPKFTYESFDEMQEKAAKHNISDPRLWCERILLEPSVGVYRREALDSAGKIFDYGFFHSGSDYDLGFRFRRAGFKTILCKDTFVQHDHPRLNLEGKAREDRFRDLQAARRDFQRKYFGIDGWADGSNFELGLVSLINLQEFETRKQVEVLGIDVRCGSPILEIKNKLQEGNHFDTRLSAFTTDPKYWLDLKTLCAGEVVVDRMDFFDAHFSDRQFDIILLGNHINTYPQSAELFQQLLKRVKPDGHLLLKLKNTFDVVSTLKSLGAVFPADDMSELPAYRLNIDDLFSQAKSLGFDFKKINVENWPQDPRIQEIMNKVISTAGFAEDKTKALTRAFVRDFVIDIAR